MTKRQLQAAGGHIQQSGPYDHPGPDEPSQDIPVGALARYVLAKWAASGSDGLLEIGPMVVRQMQQVVDRAESEGTPEAKVAAYQSLRQIISWLAVPLEKPE